MNHEIFIIIGSLERGGAERHLTYVLPLLVGYGWKLTVVSLSPRTSLASILEQGGIKVWRPPEALSFLPSFLKKLFYLTAVIPKLWGLYRRYPYNLFHYFLPEAYMIGLTMALFARHKGPRLMSRRSLNVYQKRHPFLGWIERKLHSHTDFFLANSQRVLDELKQEIGLWANRTGLFYNGIPLPKATRCLRPTLTMMIVANLIPYKGHMDLFKALGSIKTYLPQGWELWVVGADSCGHQNSLKSFCNTLGIGSQVHFLGARCDVENLWPQCHLGILASHEEGFSNAILEAMAAGVPLVVTDVGGNAEAVIDGVTGWVVPAQQPLTMGQAILKLATQPTLAQAMGKAARERVEKYFTLEIAVKGYHHLYKQFLKDTVDLNKG